jgi:hypothetical protein
MGTRSDIIVHRADGSWARIYCHWDGHIDHNGRILFEHYSEQSKAEALVALGDLSSLGPEIGDKHDFDWQMKYAGRHGKQPDAAYERLDRMCNAYGRDRGETGVNAKIGDSLAAVWPEEGSWTEFTYAWMDGRWWVGDPDEGSSALIDLGDALAGKKRIHPSIKVPFLGVIGRHA